MLIIINECFILNLRNTKYKTLSRKQLPNTKLYTHQKEVFCLVWQSSFMTSKQCHPFPKFTKTFPSHLFSFLLRDFSLLRMQQTLHFDPYCIFKIFSVSAISSLSLSFSPLVVCDEFSILRNKGEKQRKKQKFKFYRGNPFQRKFQLKKIYPFEGNTLFTFFSLMMMAMGNGNGNSNFR